MKRTRQFLFGVVAASAAVGGVVGCFLPLPDTPPVSPKTECLAYQGSGYWYKAEPNQVTACTDGDVPTVLSFKDAEGNRVPGGGYLNAPGCVTVAAPPGAAAFDWEKAPLPGGGDPKALLPAAFSGGEFQPPELMPRGGQEYEFGCMPIQIAVADIARAYSIRVLAGSASAAHALVDPLLYHGPGTALPLGVSVDVYIEAELVGTSLEIRSSLLDRFDDFAVAVDGNLVADLHSRLNVSVTKADAGWITLTASVPLALLSEQMTVTLTQKAGNDPNTAYVILSF